MVADAAAGAVADSAEVVLVAEEALAAVADLAAVLAAVVTLVVEVREAVGNADLLMECPDKH